MTFARAERIKERHEAELLSLPGVEGVGLVEERGHPAIKVYVESVRVTEAVLPRTVEDLPVVVEESGRFEPY
jgi:hypothetical protein